MVTQPKSLSDVYFKKDQKGNIVYFPRGIWGRGRIVDEAKEKKLRFLLRINTIPTIAIVALTYSFGWRVLVLGLLIVAWLTVSVKRIIRDCPYSDLQLNTKEIYSHFVSLDSKPKLWFICVGSALFAMLGVWMLMAEGPSVASLGGIIFFGACAVLSALMLRTKYAQKY
jgi:hypothetical protein